MAWPPTCRTLRVIRNVLNTGIVDRRGVSRASYLMANRSLELQDGQKVRKIVNGKMVDDSDERSR